MGWKRPKGHSKGKGPLLYNASRAVQKKTASNRHTAPLDLGEAILTTQEKDVRTYFGEQALLPVARYACWGCGGCIVVVFRQHGGGGGGVE